MNPYASINIIKNILDSNNVDYFLEGNTLYLKEKKQSPSFSPSYFDSRNWFYISSSYNKIYEAISRCEIIRILDFTKSEGIPPYFYGFPFLEEVRIGNKSILPIFLECPRLARVIFNPENISSIGRDSFYGWPHLDILRLGGNLNKIETFSLTNADITVLDLSCTKWKHLPEHAFQNSKFEKIILPNDVRILPEYLFCTCKNLKEVIGEGVEEVKWNVFKECPQLSFLKFNENFNIKAFERILNNKSGSEEYFLSRCGIIISNDEDYSYIWCFTDFRFYYTERLDCSLNFKIVSFYRSNNRIINKAMNGECTIASEYNNYHAIEIHLNGFKATSRKYDTVSKENKKIDPQKHAIALYENLQNTPIQSVKNKIDEDNRLVESLNIDEIISSFRTNVNEYVITKVGGDDTFISEITRGSIYSDPYIDKLLPPRSDSYRESGYTSIWPWTSKEEIQKMRNEDELLKNKARELYNKEDHKKYLIDNYIEQLISSRLEIEKYLHIDFATNIFCSINAQLCGFDRIFKLNMLLSSRTPLL